MTKEDLKEMQQWSLSQKVNHSLEIIDSFIHRVGGVNRVYVSFSGGKDSTVLLDLCQKLYPDILAVFCITGNEYPEICRFVREKREAGSNIEIIRPKQTPRQIWEKFGFPLISKESAQRINAIRNNPNGAIAKRALGESEIKTKFGLAKKWLWLVDEDFNCHNECCRVLKKRPFHIYARKTGRHSIIGTMASESKMREQQYLRHGGCNVFKEAGECRSTPLAIWNESDIWAYVDKFNLRLADIYYKGAKRCGCMGCGFGAQFPDDDRFSLLYKEHPRAYSMIMNYTNHGIRFEDALRKILAIDGRKLPHDVDFIEP